MILPPAPVPIPYRVTLDARSALVLMWDIGPNFAEVFDDETGQRMAVLAECEAVAVRCMWVRPPGRPWYVPIYARPDHPPVALPYTPPSG